MLEKRCSYCSCVFYPDPRVGSRQISCREKECQEKRKKENQMRWREQNSSYWRMERLGNEEAKMEFRKQRALYMRKYRKRRPEYAKGDNERRRKARAGGKSSDYRKRRNQRLVQVDEIKRLIIGLLPCRNQNEKCPQMVQKEVDGNQLPAP